MTLFPLFADNIEKLIETWRKILNSQYDKIFSAIGKFIEIEGFKRALKKYRIF